MQTVEHNTPQHTPHTLCSVFDPIVNLQLHFPILYSRRVSSRGFASAAATPAAAVVFASAPFRTRGGVTGEAKLAAVDVGASCGAVAADGDGGEAAAAAAPAAADVVAAAMEARPEEEGEGTGPMFCGVLLLPLLLPHALRVSSTTSLRFSRHCLWWIRRGRESAVKRNMLLQISCYSRDGTGLEGSNRETFVHDMPDKHTPSRVVTVHVGT